MQEMTSLDLQDKIVLIREDLNVPMQDKKITSDARLRAALPTIKLALEKGAAIMVMSHSGRPKEGLFDEEFSLRPVVTYFEEHLDAPVRLVSDYLDGVTVLPGEVVILENVRFNKGECSNDEELSKKLAKLCDVFVMDAFGTAHRAHASTYGVAKYAKIACAGPLLVQELDALGKALSDPKRPLVAIVGGSKVSTKLEVLESLAAKVDQLIVGGGIANTFIASQGNQVGKSLCEADLFDKAKLLGENTYIPIPLDVVVATEFSASATATIKEIADVSELDMILDIGPKTAEKFAEILAKAGTIVWNGPVGVFEFDSFGNGTKVIAEAIASSDAFSIAGGGDTLAAVDKYNIASKISYISTGGGAFLEFLEGKELPAVTILKQRATLL